MYYVVMKVETAYIRFYYEKLLRGYKLYNPNYKI